jgi:nucleotide-binding universal stress UspA family protein
MTTEHDRERIVVGVDGSPSSVAALGWAARQAEHTKGTIDAVTTWQWPTSYGIGLPLAPDFLPGDEAKTVLDGVIEQVAAAHPGVAFTTQVIEGAARLVLIERSKGATLLVVGSRGHSEIGGILLGSVSEYCVAHAHCPVVVVKTGQ